MADRAFLGEFEQLVLLAILQHRDDGYAILIRGAIEEVTDRPISLGALYRTLDRLESKGLVTWELESPTRDRGGNPRKRFDVTPAGVNGLRRSRSVVSRLSAGLEDLLEPAQCVTATGSIPPALRSASFVFCSGAVPTGHQSSATFTRSSSGVRGGACGAPACGTHTKRWASGSATQHDP